MPPKTDTDPVKLLTDHNDANESQIVFVWDDQQNHVSPAAFYEAAVRKFWGDSDTETNIRRYVANAEDLDRDADFIRATIANAMAITPIIAVPLELTEIGNCRTFRYDWNVKELVWSSGSSYWYMLWETAA